MRVKIKVTKPEGDDAAAVQARLAERDRIAQDLTATFQAAATIVVQPPSRPLLSVACEQETMNKIEKRYPAASVTREIQYKLGG